MVSLIEADYLGQMRTGAATGVATKFMAREDASVAAIIGTGLQARTQLEAIAPVRKLQSIRAYGRNAERRETFAREMTERLGIPVKAVGSAEEAVRGAHIVSTATTSKEPVLDGTWLEPGMHINAIGVNQAAKRELDTEAVLRSDFIAADSREQSKIEAGDLIHAFAGDASRWETVHEFADVVAGKIKARTRRAADHAVQVERSGHRGYCGAGKIYEIAPRPEIGRDVPMWEKETRSLAERGV